MHGGPRCRVRHTQHHTTQRWQEEYQSDYTRILDLARISIVADNLHSLEATLGWLLAPERSPRFRVARVKDRLSRQW